MKRGFRSERCFFMETILGSCCGMWEPLPPLPLPAFLPGLLPGGPCRVGAPRAESDVLVERAETCCVLRTAGEGIEERRMHAGN